MLQLAIVGGLQSHVGCLQSHVVHPAYVRVSRAHVARPRMSTLVIIVVSHAAGSLHAVDLYIHTVAPITIHVVDLAAGAPLRLHAHERHARDECLFTTQE